VSGLEFSGPSGFITRVDEISTNHRSAWRPVVASSDDVLIGYATKYLESHEWNSGVEVFQKGCCAASLTSGRPLRFLIAHDPIKLVATTSDRLQVIEDDYGLGFQLKLRPEDHEIREMIARGFDGMSIGYRPLAVEDKSLDGFSFKMILNVDLAEISLCHRGAVHGAFATLSKDDGRPFADRVRAGELKLESAATTFKRALRRLGDS
jgi:HK97 family phage prohead protease